MLFLLSGKTINGSKDKNSIIPSLLLLTNLLLSSPQIYRYKSESMQGYRFVCDGQLIEAYYDKRKGIYLALTSPATRAGEPSSKNFTFMPRLASSNHVTCLEKPEEIYANLCTIYWNPANIIKRIKGLSISYSIDNLYLKTICDTYRK